MKKVGANIKIDLRKRKNSMNIESDTQVIHLKSNQPLQRPLFKYKHPGQLFLCTFHDRRKNARGLRVGRSQKQLSTQSVLRDVVMRIVRFLPNMAGVNGVKDEFFIQETADAAGRLFDL